MPADVAVQPNYLQQQSDSQHHNHHHHHHHLSQNEKSTGNAVDSCWHTENVSGNMKLVSPDGQKQPCQVNVYRTSVEHFAVIYPESNSTRPLGVLNLRNTQIERIGDDGFQIRQRGCDTPVALTFFLENTKDIDFWILAFTPRSSPLAHHSCLPIVQEEEI